MKVGPLSFLSVSVTALFSLTQPAAAQQPLSWRRLPPNSVPDCQMVFDSTRQRFVVHADRTFEWDGVAWQQRRTEHAPPPRQEFGLAFDSARRRTVLFGGRDAAGTRGDVWEYDGIDWQERTGAGPVARSAMAMAFDPLRARVVVFGGLAATGARGDTWTFDGTVWTAIPSPGPSARDHTAMAFHAASGQMVLFGGGPAMLADTWTFDGATWTQRQPATVPPLHSRHRLCSDDGNGVVRMFGGYDPAVWSWTGVDWTQGPTGPGERFGCAMAADGAGTTVLFGGARTMAWTAALPIPIVYQGGDTWRLGDSGWTRMQSGGPDYQQDAIIAYDSARDRIVSNGLVCADLQPRPTWEWDDAGWHEIHCTPLPWLLGGRMCFDLARARTVYFGGAVPVNGGLPVPQDDLYEWDGASWTLRAVSTAPPARAYHAMIHDALRSRIVLFGGIGNGGVFGDTWQWNGVAWTQLASTGPAPRGNHAMTFDSVRDRAVLFGGTDFTATFGDTWEWNGTTWLQRSVQTAPGPRHSSGFAFDPVRHRAVLDSGYGPAGNVLSDLWEWDGGAWAATPAVGSEDLYRNLATSAIAFRGGSMFRLVGSSSWLGTVVAAHGAVTGTGCGGTGVPALATFGDPVLGRAQFAVELHRAAANAPFLLGIGFGIASTPIGAGCTVYLPSLDLSFVAIAGPSGHAALAVPVPAGPNLLGLTTTLQAGALDASAPLGLALSNAVVARLGR